MAEMETGDINNKHGRKPNKRPHNGDDEEPPQQQQFVFQWPASQTTSPYSISKDKINELKETVLSKLRPLEKRYGKCLAHKAHLASDDPDICLASLKNHIGLPSFRLERYADEDQLPLIQSLTYEGQNIVDAIDAYLQEVNGHLLALFRTLREAECAALKTRVTALQKELETAFTALLPPIKTADNEQFWDALVEAGKTALAAISKECTRIQASAKESVKTPSLPAAKRDGQSQLSQQSRTQEENADLQQQHQKQSPETAGPHTTATASTEDELNMLKAKVLSLEDAQTRAANEKRNLEQQLSTIRGHQQQPTQQKNELRGGGRGNHPSLPSSPYPYAPRYNEPTSWQQPYPPLSHSGYYPLPPPGVYPYPPYPYHPHMDPSLTALNNAPPPHPFPYDAAVGGRGRGAPHVNTTGRGYRSQRGRGGRGGRL